MGIKTDKSKALGFASVLVDHHLGTQNSPKTNKHVFEIVISEVFTKIFDEDVGEALVVAVVPQSLLTRNELPNVTCRYKQGM